MPNTVKDRYKVKQWLPSKSEKNQEKLKIFCFHNATVFDDFEGEWIDLNTLKRLSNSKEFKQNTIDVNKVFQVKIDSVTRYFLINEVIYKGQVMPLKYAKDEIVRSIINRRKDRMLDELNQKINQEVDKKIQESK
jgi:hypothetical protein